MTSFGNRVAAAIVALFVLVFIAIHLWPSVMSHSRSPAAAAVRRERAVRCVLIYSVPAGRTHILVASVVDPRAKVVAKSLELHAFRNDIARNNFHFVKQAAIAVRTVIGDEAFKHAHAAHVARDHAV